MASLRPRRFRSDQILAMLEDIPSDDDSSEESVGEDHDEEDDSISNLAGMSPSCHTTTVI